LVAEVSSRGTKSLDLNEKHSVYERLEVAEYWVVDLDAGSVLIHRLGPSGYLPPETATGDDVVEPTATPGLRFTVAALLGSGVYHA
jgi:Uma2 family endonuclease